MFKKILLLSSIFILFASQSNAASLDLQSDIEKVGINSYFQVNIFLNTEDVSINTVEAKISFPKELIQLREIRNGDSIINFWVDKPKEEDGIIAFSGIIPGGYNDKNGLISSFLFESENYGAGTIEFKSLQGYENDGLGTPVDLKFSNLNFSIVDVSEKYIPIEMEDYIKPESFVPEINQTQELFDGKYFLVFAAQDKGLGVDHYEVCEGNTNECVKADSPYVLQNQELNEKIFVKAVDKKGNERLVSLLPKNYFKGYENSLIFGAIILVLLLIVLLTRKLWIKLKK
jgi:hypothetical protein